MRNRWLLNLGLLISVIALSAILLVSERAEPGKDTLAAFLPDPVNHIKIMRKGRTPIELRKQGAYWKMISPYSIHADNFQIQTLLAFARLEINVLLDTVAINSGKFGLQSPDTTIQFNQIKIMLGDTQPVGRQRYIQIGDKVMLVDDRISTPLNIGSLSMIDRHLIPRGNNIKNIKIGAQSPITPDKDGDSQQILNQWQTIKANWISLNSNDNAQGIAIQINLQQGETLDYIAQLRDTDLVLIRKNPDLEYHLQPTAIELLGLTFPGADSTTVSDSSPDEKQ